MKTFLIGMMLGLIFFPLIFRRVSLKGRSWVWVCAPIYVAIIQGLSIETSNEPEFISSRTIFYSLLYLAGFITCLPTKQSMPNAYPRIVSLAALSYIFGLIGLAAHTSPYICITFILLSMTTLSLAVQARSDLNQTTRFGVMSALALIHLASWIEVSTHHFRRETLEELLISVQLTLLLVSEANILWLLRKDSPDVSKNNQVLTPFSLRAWLEFNQTLKTYAHDLRQPLSTINIVSGVGKTIAEKEETRQRFQHIMAAHASFSNMLSDFFSNIKAQTQTNFIHKGELSDKLQPCALQPIFEALFDEYKYFADAKGLTLRFIPTDLEVMSERIALEKILRNGLDNAIKYTSQGGILISTRHAWEATSKGKVKIQIIDTGSGIENDLVPNKHKGWGFGNHIVQSLSSRIQAKVWVKNRPGSARGTCFSIVLPSANSAMETQSNKPNSPLNKRPPVVFLKGYSSDWCRKGNICLPEELDFKVSENSIIDQVVYADQDAPAVLFYLMIARSTSDLKNAQVLAEEYKRQRGHLMCLLVATEESLITEIDTFDYPDLVLTEAKKIGDMLTVPALEDIAAEPTKPTEISGARQKPIRPKMSVESDSIASNS